MYTEDMNNANAIKALPESDRIYVRGLEADISLAKYRAAKLLKAGEALRASIQDDIAYAKGIELARFWASR